MTDKNWESKLPKEHLTALHCTALHCTDCLLQQQSGILVQIEFQKSPLDSAYLSLARLLLSSARQLSSISHHEMITIIILCGRLLACYCLDGQIQEHSWSRSDSLHCVVDIYQYLVHCSRCKGNFNKYIVFIMNFPYVGGRLWWHYHTLLMFEKSQLYLKKHQAQWYLYGSNNII